MIPLSRPLVGDDEQAAVAKVLRSGRLTAGPEVESFEGEYASFITTKYAVAVGSGTAALHLGLLALGVSAGDEVLVPAFTFAATANAIRLCGARPVFVDVDPVTYCIDPDAVAATLTPRSVAVIAVHLYGNPANLRRLREIAQGANIGLVEDAAQAHGSSWESTAVGAWGAFGAFSFYPTKNMTTGEGGMVTTDDEALARRIRLLRNQGMEKRYWHEIVGMNERMTEIEAAIGRVQLQKLAGWNESRRENAAFYGSNLKQPTVTPRAMPEAVHVFHQYTVRLPERDRTAKYLKEGGIGTGVYYPTPVHRQPAYTDIGGDHPVSQQLAEEVLSIPVRPDLTEKERELVVERLNEAVNL